MRIVTLFGSLPGLVLIVGSAQAQVDSQSSCEALLNANVSIEAIRLPIGGVELTDAVYVDATGRTVAENGDIMLELAAHCRVQGAIAPVDPEAPPILFNINLPVEWNGKAIHSGGGGLGGSRRTSPGDKGSGRYDPQPMTDTYPLTQGYVTFGGDEGHQGGDHQFIYNDEAMRNWGYQSFMKVRDVAGALIEEAYGQVPDRVYFVGESAGGREAVTMAQRFPEAYDGIIAVSPVLSWTYDHIGSMNIRDALFDGWLDADDIAFITEQTEAACDAEDGLEDGIIARYMECHMDMQALRCPNGGEGMECLSDAQIEAVNAIRNPYSMLVPMPHGVTRYPGLGVTGGEDAPDNQWSFYTVGTTPPVHPLPEGRGWQRGLGGVLNFAALWVRHAIAQDETHQPTDFYPPDYTDRIQYLASMFDATNPDLSRLHNRGGKLIIMAQSADNAVSTAMIAEYYRSVLAAMGPDVADEFVRLYVGPGGTHNGDGVGQADLLDLLEAWAEEGDAPPDTLPIHEIDPKTHETKRSMVACVYPNYTRYNGSGDITESSSFHCAERPDPLEYPRSQH